MAVRRTGSPQTSPSYGMAVRRTGLGLGLPTIELDEPKIM